MRAAGFRPWSYGLLVFAMTLPAAGQVRETTKQEDLERLFAAAGVDAQTDAMLETMGRGLANSLISQLPDGPEAGQARGALARYLDLLRTRFGERMPAVFFQIYDESFTQEEVRSLLEFWESDVGQRMRDLGPGIAEAGMQAGTNLVAALLPGIAAEMAADYPEFAAGLRMAVIESLDGTTYVNRTVRFSLETPPGWVVNGSTRVQANAAAWLDSPDRTAAVTVAIRAGGTSLAELASLIESRETIEGFANRKISEEETTVGGFPALVTVTQTGPVATVRAFIKEPAEQEGQSDQEPAEQGAGRIAIVSGRTTIARLEEDEPMLRAIVTSYRVLPPPPGAP